MEEALGDVVFHYLCKCRREGDDDPIVGCICSVVFVGTGSAELVTRHVLFAVNIIGES